ncbi:hypothetical protein L2734_10910 [Parashewanella spongiae]|nr:hypothetical protein [Parashewanella spongiae]MCL1078660.1 hypothetical protein [Parashewanella spongiae]
MNIENLLSLAALKEFIDGNQPVAFTVLGSKSKKYQFIQKTLIKLTYLTLPRSDKGIVKR